MDRLLQDEFNKIVIDFNNDIDKAKKNLSFSIVGTPLKECPILLVGNNWGGKVNIPSQTKMPLANDILVYPEVSTYMGYIDFFTFLFSNNKLQTIDFLNKIVYTNGNLIRTPNESNKYKELLEYGHQLSLKYLKRLISLIKPHIIICFGNGDKSATSAIFKSFGITKDFWKHDNIITIKTENNWNTYMINITINEINYKIFSFPHSSRFNTWKKNIGSNTNFQELKKEIIKR